MDPHESGGGDGFDRGDSSSGVLKKPSEFKQLMEEEPHRASPSFGAEVLSLYPDKVGEVDMSDARELCVDGESIKKSCSSSYEAILDFSIQCNQKCALKIFTHPGQNGVPGGLASYVGRQVNMDKFYLQLACLAIEIHNHLWEEAKLVLDKILRVNFLLSAGENYYVTFVAFDQITYEFKIYKAAFKGVHALKKLPYTDKTFVGPKAEARYVLGLFIDCSTDKILVALSITGAEEDLKAKKKIIEDLKAKKKIIEDATAEGVEEDLEIIED